VVVRRQEGQALPLALGGVFVLIVGALALVAIAGAVTGKGRVQRAADLAAISAARSMRDDLPRLLAPPTLPNGLPNPMHMEKVVYLLRAREAALEAGRANGVGLGRLRVSFPDLLSFAPVQARVEVLAEVEAGRRSGRVSASAVAEAAAPPSAMAMPSMASGGGYSGPLVYRQGHGMRPDVAAAFDRMAAAAARAGVSLVVNSAFRSDAEQAALFAAHPDPQWVAPPGHSLHRCATELDLGPSGAYGWLAANAVRFGFLQRYSWEPWHYGFARGPPPCSQAGNAVGAGGGGDGAISGAAGLPSFVPARFQAPLLAAASRWGVSAALLAAQLMAESNFNPFAVSPAGAQGIAQFIPSTAASYGLRDPFDPVEAIEAQAHLMSDLIRRFGSPQLALAAYNAGPGAVEGCQCVPSIPETAAYVSRILALLSGAGALALPTFEVRLVA
jgi:Transglycosylase SLT domain/D-alanyl-D-alanine carboxypeptidase/Putative Flp pilus-assembly TadE/G-like